MQASPPLQFPAGASPFQIGGNPLFKTAGNEPIAAPPINSASGMSPFSIIGATPTNSPLTVGDVINQLPAEVVRMGALPAEQPLSLPPALLENALRSGQAALPVFELYRVCPALFQVPISPQDPRLVALPAAKLPGLIAQAREGNGALPAPASAASPSPFSFAQPATPTPAPVGSPFQMAPLASNPAVQQPPPSPFSLGVSPSGSPFGMSQQPAAVAPAPGSPFSLGASPGASPFGMSQQPAAAAPAPSPGSPFSFGATPSGSPFGMSQQPEATSLAPSPGSPFSLGASPGASPFGMSQQPAAAAPSTLSESPFSLGAGSSGSPFGMAQQPAAVEPPPIPGSPFSFGSGQGGSPFGMSQQPVAAPPATSPGSPFSPAPPENWASSAPAASQPQASISTLFTPPALQRASTPSDMAAAPAMPFGSPFVAAMKDAAPLVESPAPNAFASQPQSAAPGNASSTSGGMAKLGFAAVLGGYSVEELGFNPTTLPAWITTSVQDSALNEQISSGNIVLELGMLIDGISDLGFRNTLTNAKRDFKIKLPQNEVFHSLTNTSAVPATPASFGSPSPTTLPARLAVQPNPPQQPTQNSQPMFAASFAPAPAESPPMFGAALAPFTQSQPSPASAPVSAFGSAQAASGPAQFAFSPPSPPAETAPPPVSPALFPAAQPTTASPSKPLQPLIGAFQSFGASQAASLAQTAPPPNSTHPGTAKPFDPFASSSTGPLAAKASAESGFNSAQLLGQVPTTPQQPVSAFTPAPETKPATSLFATPTPALSPFQPTPSFAPALEEIPSFSTPAPPAPQPASRGLFSTQAATVPLFSEPVTPQARPEPKPVPAAPALQATPSAAPAKMAAVKHSFLGLSPLDTQTDQLLLRALLGTEEKLSAPRVVELLALQQGLSACVCLHGSHVLSHADSSKTDAVEFQRQAPDIARQLRGLAPLIGIEGAETFTLNAGGRLLTFCFPGDSIIGVLHDDEPSTGMRDKITLIARELARMLG